MKQNKKKMHFAWFVLVGLSIMIGFARGGINNAGGLFLTPVSEELGIGMGSLTLYFSISAIVTMIFLPIAGKIMAKYDIRTILIGGIILQAGSFAIFGFMNSVWGWYLFSIPMSIGGIFVTQMAGPVLINNWFKKHNGLALGIMMAAVGAFGAVLQPMAGRLIASEGWRSTYLILGISAIVIVVPVILLTIRMAPQHKGLLPFGMNQIPESKNTDFNSESTNKGVTFAVAKKSSAFYALLLFFFFVTAIGSFSQHIAPFAMGLGYNVEFAGNTMGIFMLGVLAGALAFGILSDKIGAKNTAVFAMTTGLISIGMLLVVADNPTLFTIAIGIFGFVTASIGTLTPLLTSSIFGNKEYSQIYATAALGLAIAGVVALPGYGFIFELTGTYTFVLFAIAAMLIINIFTVIIAFRGKKKLEDAGVWN